MSAVIDSVANKSVDNLAKLGAAGTADVNGAIAAGQAEVKHIQSVSNSIVNTAVADRQAAESRLDDFINKHHWQILGGVVLLIVIAGGVVWAKVHGAL